MRIRRHDALPCDARNCGAAGHGDYDRRRWLSVLDFWRHTILSSRSLDDLSLDMNRLAMDFLDGCATDRWLLDAGVTVLVTCTWRSPTEQDDLYAQGRTKPGAIVTRARAGQSKHNAVDVSGMRASEALDIVPLRHGKPVWGTKGNGIDDDPLDDSTDDLEVWQRIGVIGKSCGLKWYGDPAAPFREFPHFQNPAA